MDKETWESIRDFSIQYPLWMLVDWVRDTTSGKVLATALASAVMTRLAAWARDWQPAAKQRLNGALVACVFIFSVVGLATLLSGPAHAPNSAATSPSPSVSGLIQRYGNIDNKVCGATIDGSKLASFWDDKYEFALVCGANEAGTDRYLSQGITISPLHIIRAEPIMINVSQVPK
jgi:hypothetical protein